MSPLVLDCEVTGAQRNKGNPFDPRNKLMCISFRDGGFNKDVLNIEHGSDPYAKNLHLTQVHINASNLLVGFNLKYDMHWLRRYGIRFDFKRVWDAQLYHFIRTNQKHSLPSLNDVCAFYNISPKLDIVNAEFWSKGLDTDVVPWEILEEYAAYDVEATYQCFLKQQEEFQQLPKNRQNLIFLQMEDLIVLEEMEFNGFKYNVEKSLAMGRELESEIAQIDNELATYCPNLSISFNSNQQLSAFLFGGSVFREEYETYSYTYKDGRIADKTRKIKKEYQLPRIFVPDPRTEKESGYFSVDVAALKILRYKNSNGFRARVLDLLLKRSKLEKRKSTYCYGTPKLLQEMNWENSLLHPQLNQCIVVTGRLSASKPNVQNQDWEMQQCFISRFPING